MDMFERFNTKFGAWYEGLFGGEGGELRPKDVLRKITQAMEDNRKEGFDGKVYVPNKYVLELAVGDPEERDYLLSFLDEEELVSVLQRFMAQNHYQARGPLDFTIAEVPEDERAARKEKLRVKVRFEKGIAPAPPLPGTGEPPPPRPSATGVPEGRERGLSHGAILSSQGARPQEFMPQAPVPAAGGGGDDLPTVPGFSLADDEPGTVPAVAWAALAVTNPDGRKSHHSLTKPVVTIGRSRNGGNDLVLDTDGMVSKTHARLERERDGRWTIYDLGSTNGVQVAGTRISGNRVLQDGDILTIGATALVFHDTAGEDMDGGAEATAPLRRARLVTGGGTEHVLASETLLGRAVTSDIVLPDPTVSGRHARIVAPDAATYFVEDLGSTHGTLLNDAPVVPGQRARLQDGDRLRLGDTTLRFAGGLRP